MRNDRCVWLLVGVLLAGSPAWGADGVVEINAASASAGGITPGDAPGFPVTLSLPGSYRVTGNLTNADPNTHIIQITANDVTLDLGGFTLSGPAACASFPCTNLGNGRGVVGYPADNVTVKNGTVRGAAIFGIELVGAGQRIDHVRTFGNAGNGIQIYGSALITGVDSEGNGDFGLFLLDGVVTDSTFSLNRNGGISFGVYGDGRGLAARNTVLGNGITPSPAFLTAGILGGSVALLSNMLLGNASNAFVIGSNSGWGQNVLSGNGGPGVGGLQLGGNMCDGVAC